jgi:NADH-quinone oxidoreductase subunit A
MAPDERLVKSRFSVKFYLVAMLFILFDIEAAFMIPWAVTFKQFAADKVFVLVEMLVFLGILIAGFAYVWARGALEWE